MSSQVLVGQRRCRTYKKGEKAYWVKKPIVPIVIKIEIDEEVITMKTKIKVIASGQVERERLIYDVLVGVLEKMTRSTLWKDTLYEMREASLITQAFTPTLDSLTVNVKEKEKSLTPAPKSIDDQDHKHE